MTDREPLRHRQPKSLTVRIPLILVGVQAACVILALLAFPLLAPFTNYDTVADTTVRRLVEAALTRDANGGLRIESTQALRDYAASRPNLNYAVIGPEAKLAVGSMPEMAALLQRLSPSLPKPDANLETYRSGASGNSAFITTDRTRFGILTVATAGNEFKFEDVPSFVYVFLPAILPAYGPVLVGGLIILPLLLRRMLRPLREVAQAAAQIDPRKPGRHLPTAGLPAELFPAVTEINTALDRLAEGWAQQSLFTANAAHELRTPVAILQARIDTMPHGALDHAALASDVRRLRLLVDQLLSVARLDHRESPLDAPIDLVASVRDLVADCAPLALRNGRNVAFHALSGSARVLGDSRAVEGAVANLIDNALRAEPAGGTVDVVVYGDGDGAGAGVVEVRDHGSGVAPSDRELVFEPFWRKDDEAPGTGLGLAAVREVARQHRGSITVSETPGGGATFRLAFPAASSA